jgi:hypothetical protein
LFDFCKAKEVKLVLNVRGKVEYTLKVAGYVFFSYYNYYLFVYINVHILFNVHMYI